MKRIILLFILLALVLSCKKPLDSADLGNGMSLLELKVLGQLGTAVIERDDDECRATVYVMDRLDYPYSAVPVEGIVVSHGATPSVDNGGTLNFSNPERRARITVTSASGHSLVWNIYLEAYDAFYVGEWAIINVKLHCNQRVSGSGDGAWDTPLNGSEFGSFGLPEYDDHVIIEMDETPEDNMLTGTITHTPGLDGEYGHFWGVYSPYSESEPLDMDPRLRHLLPQGEATWKLDLTTGQMRITKNNVTSTMFFGTDEWDNTLFRFTLQNAGNEPSRDGFYDNMWRSSTELFYVMTKIK